MTRSIYHPVYWPAWCLIGVLWLLIQLLSYRMLLCLGKIIGLLIFKLDKRQRHIASVNINLCFPSLDDKEKANLLRQSFISVGIGIFETGLAWWGSDRKLKNLGHIHGIDNLKATKKDGKGLILFGIHFTTLEIAGRLFALHGCDFAIIYRAHKNAFINHLMKKIRQKRYPLAIERNNVRAILKALKQGKVIWYTPDIDAGYYDHIFVPFFGISAASMTATSRLALISKSNALVSTYYRRDDGTGYDIYLSPKLENFPTKNIKKDVTLINQKIEEAVLKKPEQYLWQYKRFKTRPKDERRFYSTK